MSTYSWYGGYGGYGGAGDTEVHGGAASTSTLTLRNTVNTHLIDDIFNVSPVKLIIFSQQN